MGILHPGVMGAAVAGQAARWASTVLWCSTGRSLATVARARRAGLTDCPNLRELCAQASIIMSICPPEHAEAVAASVSAVDFRGIYLEANALSPMRMMGLIRRYPRLSVVDGSLIGSPVTATAEVTLCLAGDPAETRSVQELFHRTRVQTEVLAAEIPVASALKMAQSSYQKASRALAAVALALAQEYNIVGPLIDQAKKFAEGSLAQPDYLPMVAARAWRWAPELRDVAQTLQSAGLPDDHAQAAAAVFGAWADHKDHPPSWDKMLADLQAHRLAEGP